MNSLQTEACALSFAISSIPPRVSDYNLANKLTRLRAREIYYVFGNLQETVVFIKYLRES
jgi:hypothetical protein